MGHWITVHLFDSKMFEERIIPLLKSNKDDLKPYYIEYMKTSVTGGIQNRTQRQVEAECEEKINDIFHSFSLFDSKLEKHADFDKLPDYNTRLEYCNRIDWYYDFFRFFEHIMFSTCTDFFPHLLCGKRGLEWNLTYPGQSLASELISMLDRGVGNTLFSAEGAGIISWLSVEDTKLLHYDRSNITSDDDMFLQSFLKIVELAHDHSLGLLTGVDLREKILEDLQGYKLINREKVNGDSGMGELGKIRME